MSQREIRSIGIVAKPHKAEARDVLRQLVPWLKAWERKILLDPPCPSVVTRRPA